MSIHPNKKRLTYQDMAQQREYENHIRRLNEQRPAIDNETPASCRYTRTVGDVRDHRRQRQIEYDNEILVRNMCRIMETGGGVDNKPPHVNFNKAIYSERSRNLEQQRIAKENAKLLDRLERTQPTYKNEKFEKDRARNEMLASRISTYTYEPMDRSGYQVRSRTDVE